MYFSNTHFVATFSHPTVFFTKAFQNIAELIVLLGESMVYSNIKILFMKISVAS